MPFPDEIQSSGFRGVRTAKFHKCHHLLTGIDPGAALPNTDGERDQCKLYGTGNDETNITIQYKQQNPSKSVMSGLRVGMDLFSHNPDAYNLVRFGS